jgi:hypothetical protein
MSTFQEVVAVAVWPTFLAVVFFGSNPSFISQLSQHPRYLSLGLSSLCVASGACHCKMTGERDGAQIRYIRRRQPKSVSLLQYIPRTAYCRLS